MKTYFLILFGLIFLGLITNSCRLLGVCEDESLSLTRTNYIGQQLKVEGYYFGDTISLSNNTQAVSMTYIYRNGVILSLGSIELAKIISNDIPSLNSTELKNLKKLWGVFSIEGNKITIEKWSFEQYQCFKRQRIEAEILNDTTYILKSSNKIYRFRASSVKPDSTNNFIK
jgi:hypothetical protein